MSSNQLWKRDDGTIINIDRDDSGSVEASITFDNHEGDHTLRLSVAWGAEKGAALTDEEIIEYLVKGAENQKHRSRLGAVRRVRLPFRFTATFGKVEDRNIDEALLRIGALSVSSKIDTNESGETTIHAPEVKWNGKDAALFGIGYKKALFARFSRERGNW